MSKQINSQFKIESWDEEPFNEDENGPDLTRASVRQTYSGKLEGEGILEYLITSFDKDYSHFIGIERVTGQLDGRTGSFVLNHQGVHEDGVAKSGFMIERGSGTGDLKGIHGKGHFEASHEKSIFTIEYDFE